MSIRPRKLASGRTVYDAIIYYNDGGQRRRKQKAAPSIQAARLMELQLLEQYGCLRDYERDIPLAEYIERVYWPIASRRLAPSSLDTYEKEIRLRIVPALGGYRLSELTRELIQSNLVDNCASRNVAQKALGVLKTIINDAVSNGYTSTNYARAKFALPHTAPRKRDNGLVLSTFAQIYSMLAIVDVNASVSVQRIVYTGLLLGLRPEERYALSWSDIDMHAQSVTIHAARTQALAKHGGNAIKATKTRNGNRIIPMHPLFADFIERTPHGHGAFIKSASGGHITPPTAQHRWTRFLEDTPECPPITIENMRHSYATAYISAGGNVETLSRILGHASIITTINRYYRPSVDALRSDLLKITDNGFLPPLPQFNAMTRSSILRASTSDE